MLIKIRIERQKREKNKKKNNIYKKKRNAAAPSSVRKNLYRRITAHNIVPRGRSLRLHDIENIKWAFTMLEEFRNYGQVRWARRAFRQRRCLRGTREENRYEGRVHVISRQKKFPFLSFFFFNRTVDQSTLQGQCFIVDHFSFRSFSLFPIHSSSSVFYKRSRKLYYTRWS